MGLAEIVATVMLAILILFVGMVVIATLHQVRDESRRLEEEI